MFIKITLLLSIFLLFACSPKKVEPKKRVKREPETTAADRHAFELRMKKLRDRRREQLLKNRGNLAEQRRKAEENLYLEIQNNPVALAKHYSSRARSFYNNEDYANALRYARKSYKLNKRNREALKVFKDLRGIGKMVEMTKKLKEEMKNKKRKLSGNRMIIVK